MEPLPGMLFSLAWIACTALMYRYGIVVHGKEQAAIVAAGLVSPDEVDLLTYISALGNEREEVRNQASKILVTLLGKLSEERLSSLGDFYWTVLCSVPGNSIGRDYVFDRDDDLNLAVISAATKLKRMKSLACVECLMTHIDRKPHSDNYVNTLAECYRVLTSGQVGHKQPSLLLRPSEAPSSSDILLRPASDTTRTHAETGEQLLRSSAGGDTAPSNREDRFLSDRHQDLRGIAAEYRKLD